MNRRIKKKAFTIIELLVVIAVLGVLVFLAAPGLLNYTNEAQLARIQNDVRVIESKVSEELVKSNNGFQSWEDNNKDLSVLILKNQLFEREGIADKVNVEHLSKLNNKVSYLTNSNLGLGGVAYNLEQEPINPSSGYKIIPESLINEANTRLDGTFYTNSYGKVYYEPNKEVSYGKSEQKLACVSAESLDYEFDGSTGTITKYNGKLQHIIIPGAFEVNGECVPVRVIGVGAFMSGDFKEIRIPQSVKIIRENAFRDNDLVEIEIPHSVDYIGSNAFSDNKLEEVIIKKESSNIIIENDSFDNNGPEGTSAIEPTYKLPTLEDLNIIFDKSTGTIVSGDTRSSSLDIPDNNDDNSDDNNSNGGGKPGSGSEEEIEDSNEKVKISYNNSNRTISIPETIEIDEKEYKVKKIAKGAFQGEGIIYVEFPDSLEMIDDYAFAGNQIIGLNIPNSVNHIGNYAFAFNEIEVVDKKKTKTKKTINYVNILDDDYEPKINNLGDIATNGVKVEKLSNKVNLLKHIFVTSDSDLKIPGEIIVTRPNAVISMSPERGITPKTKITWSYENSSDPNGLDIIDVEWEGNDEFKEEGQHEVKLRVKNSNEIWSEWTIMDFYVDKEIINPDRPLGLIAKPTPIYRDSTVDISWNEIQNWGRPVRDTYYRLEVSYNRSNDFIHLGTFKDTNFTHHIPKSTINNQVSYRVRAENSQAVSNWRVVNYNLAITDIAVYTGAGETYSHIIEEDGEYMLVSKGSYGGRGGSMNNSSGSSGKQGEINAAVMKFKKGDVIHIEIGKVGGNGSNGNHYGGTTGGRGGEGTIATFNDKDGEIIISAKGGQGGDGAPRGGVRPKGRDGLGSNVINDNAIQLQLTNSYPFISSGGLTIEKWVE